MTDNCWCQWEETTTGPVRSVICAAHVRQMGQAFRPRLASEMPGWVGSEPPADVLTEDDSWDRWPA